MILYHYTSKQNLEGILSTGLSRGEAPLNEDKVANAVNLTSDPAPWGEPRRVCRRHWVVSHAALSMLAAAA